MAAYYIIFKKILKEYQMYIQNKIKGFGLKRIILAVFAVCFLASAALLSVIAGGGGISDGRTAYAEDDTQQGQTTYDAVGSGTNVAPWLIGNATQLKDLANKVNGVAPYAGSPSDMSGKYIKLTANIDLSAYKGGAGWEPIGNRSITSSIYFAGDFDGGGFEVSNLYINTTASFATHAGLFGCLGSAGTVKNLGVSGSVSASGSLYNYAGGIVGQNYGSIISCYNTGSVSASGGRDNSAGGIAGRNFGSIENCYNTGSVSASGDSISNYAGGIAGNNDGSIISCYNTGSVSASGGSNNNNYAGGIAGETYSSNGSIESCYNTGSVSASGGSNSNNFAGGITGYNRDSGSIESCYNTGSVSASGGQYNYAGGIAGINDYGSIESCYNTGSVSASGGSMSNYAGGIAGGSSNNNITSSYYNKEKFTGAAVGYGTTPSYTADLTTAQMTADDTLTAGGAIGLGTAFSKRAKDLTNGIVYYPELKVFSESASAEVNAASKASVSINLYTITYHDVYGVQNGNPAYYFKESATFSLSVLGARAGGTFAGWYTDQELTNPAQAIAQGSTGNKNFYAKWNVYTYTVLYIANGGDGTMTNSTHTYDADEKLAANGYSKTGYAFTGWSTAEGGEGTAYSAGQSIRTLTANSSGTLSLYAQWEANAYTVRYDKNGDDVTGTTEDSLFTYGVSAPLRKNEYSKTGYTFKHWSERSDGSGATRYDDGTDVINLTLSGGEVTLYAQWEPNVYRVSYDGNGNTGGLTEASMHIYYSDWILASNAYTKTGYSFAGWNTLEDGSGDAYADGESIRDLIAAGSGDLKLYARWELSTYTITYNGLEGAKNGNLNLGGYTVESGAITLASLRREGYSFDGWYGAADFGGEAVTSIAAGSTGNKEFWAKWTKLADEDEDGGEDPQLLLIPVAAGAGVILFFAIRAIAGRRKKRKAAALAQARSGMQVSLAPGRRHQRLNAQRGLRRGPNPYRQPPMQGGINGQNPYNNRSIRGNPYDPNGNNPYNPYDPYNPYNPYNQNGGR
jgi:uncharacterized repeat protein (TIGR02543 family)